MGTTRRFILTVALASSALVLGPGLGSASAQSPAGAYAVMDSTTNYILDSSNAQKKVQVGSLTKIATAMVVLDWAEATNQDLSQLATVPNSAGPLANGQGVNYQPGDRCSLRDLLYAALLQSDNQAAETLANHVGQTLGNDPKVPPVTTFVAQMNALARKQGMRNTRFTNAHGLDHLEKTAPYSTAEDMARLACYAMNRSAFRFYVSQKERRISLQNANGEQSSYLLKNTNELLGVDNIDGVKTGTTRKAGQCLVISSARSPESRQEGETHIITPRRLEVVVLNAPDRFGVARSLLAKGWQLYDSWAAAGRPLKSGGGRR